MTENIEKPSSLVRFYGNPEHALSCLVNNQLSLGRVENFNDPFDPVLDFIFEFEDYDQLIAWLEKHKIKMKRDVRAFKKQFPKEKFIAKTGENVIRQLREPLYAACFCTDYKKVYIDEKTSETKNKIIKPQNNLYMWGHYANGHRGIAIEFNKVKLDEIGKNDIKLPVYNSPQIFQIEYKEENGLSVIGCEDFYKVVIGNKKIEEVLGESFLQNIKIKTKNWEYESEWRLVAEDKALPKRTVIELQENSISAIYLGCMINKESKDLIVRLANNYQPNAKIYQATKHLKKLEITFDEIG